MPVSHIHSLGRTASITCVLLLLAFTFASMSPTVAAISSSQTASTGQNRHQATKSQIPRMPDGRPSLEGTWDFATATPLERPKQFAGKPVLTDKEAEEYINSLPKDGCRIINCDGSSQGRVESAYGEAWWGWGQTLADNRTSLIVDPPDGRIPPLTDAARQRLTAARAKAFGPIDGPEGLRLADRCLAAFTGGPPLTPSAYNNNLQLVQTRDYVVILAEMIHDARIVHLGSKNTAPPSLRRWTGFSQGRWEGDVFIVQTTQFRADSPVQGSKPEEFKLTERFERRDADTLVYEYTMDDSNTWVRPWTVRLPMKRTDDQIFEYACHEGNYSLPNILSAIRATSGQQEDRK